MTSIMQINSRVRSLALGGIKVPHSVSWPVLRKGKGGLVIAYYTTVYNKRKLDEDRMPRPSEWMEFDIRDGRLIGRSMPLRLTRTFELMPYDLFTVFR